MRFKREAYFRDTVGGRGIGSATVTVYQANTTTSVTIYDDFTGSARSDNTLTTDGTGRYKYFVDEDDNIDNLQFKEVLSKTGTSDLVIDYINIMTFGPIARIDDTLQSTYLGTLAGDSITTGTDNTLIGYNAGTAVTTGNYNTYIGRNAGLVATDSDFGVLIGRDAGTALTTGLYPTLIGYNAGINLTAEQDCTFIGGAAGRDIDNSAIGDGKNGETVIIGSFAGFQAGAVKATVLVGFAAGSNLNDVSGNGLNTFVGMTAGENATTTILSTLIGGNAGINMTTGARNLCLGYNAGVDTNALIDSNFCTFLGTQTGFSTADTGSLTYACAIGYEAHVGIANGFVLGGTGAEHVHVGIGTATPSENADLTLANLGALCLKEITTPTADATFGKIYTKNSNLFFFQDGAGTEHEVITDQTTEYATLTDTSDASALHNHTTANLNDTTATGSNLNTLTDDSVADTLHRHSELSASDGTPNATLSIDTVGNVTIDVGLNVVCVNDTVVCNNNEVVFS